MSLIVGKVASEFEIQAYLYWMVKATSPQVRGEVRCTVAGKKARFDLIVFNETGAPAYAIEVKPKRSMKWRAMWVNTRQGKCYASLPIPVFMVCGQQEAEAFIAATILLSSMPAGLVWREQWAA